MTEEKIKDEFIKLSNSRMEALVTMNYYKSFQRSDDGRYKLPRRQLIESLIEALWQELENI